MNSLPLALQVTQEKPLARLEFARRLLAEVRSLDEVNDIHDLANAAWAKPQNRYLEPMFW